MQSLVCFVGISSEEEEEEETEDAAPLGMELEKGIKELLKEPALNNNPACSDISEAALEAWRRFGVQSSFGECGVLGELREIPNS